MVLYGMYILGSTKALTVDPCPLGLPEIWALGCIQRLASHADADRADNSGCTTACLAEPGTATFLLGLLLWSHFPERPVTVPFSNS